MTATLSIPEAKRLAQLEAIVEEGLDSFMAVGQALAEIRDSKLYRCAHDSFGGYCKARWGIGRRHGDRLVQAWEVAQELDGQDGKDRAQVRPIGLTCAPDTPSIPESQLRELAALPKGERKEAWDKAVEATNGKVTAKAVKKVVDAKLGRTKINGVVAPDPPQIRELRKAGVIPQGADVEIVEPDNDTDTTTEEEEDEQPETLQSWLDGLPLANELEGLQLRTFQRDATIYWAMSAARKTYRHHFRRALKAYAGKRDGTKEGEYVHRIKYALSLPDPRDWILCAKGPRGGCDGTGLVPVTGQCVSCLGRGYRVK